mgnify:CR=1 FL=1
MSFQTTYGPDGRLRVAILGCTGSIGTQALDVCRQHADRLQVTALSVNSSTSELVAAAREFSVPAVAVADVAHGDDAVLQELPEGTKLGVGAQVSVDGFLHLGWHGHHGDDGHAGCCGNIVYRGEVFRIRHGYGDAPVDEDQRRGREADQDAAEQGGAGGEMGPVDQHRESPEHGAGGVSPRQHPGVKTRIL